MRLYKAILYINLIPKERKKKRKRKREREKEIMIFRIYEKYFPLSSENKNVR